MYVPQRRAVWHDIRKNVRLTGSTFGKVIGLNDLSSQKEHYHIFVNGRNPPPIPPEVQQMLDYGTKFKIKGIGTLVRQIMPSLLPPCYAFFEIGCLLCDTLSRPNNIAISCNGLLQCIHGESQCKHYQVRRHKCIMVEIKSPFPQQHLPEEPYYEVPAKHVPQLLCEMFYFSADELWPICVTCRSVSLIIVYFEQCLFDKLLQIADDLYGQEKVKLPIHLHHDIHTIKDDIKQFTKHIVILYLKYQLLVVKWASFQHLHMSHHIQFHLYLYRTMLTWLKYKKIHVL